jgi:hypothetical protein
VQHGAHLVRRQINVGFAVITLNETMPITVTRDSAFEFGKQSGAWTAAVSTCFDKNLSFLRWLLRVQELRQWCKTAPEFLFDYCSSFQNSAVAQR